MQLSEWKIGRPAEFLRSRLSARPDSEHEQAAIGLAITVAVLLYIGFLWLRGPSSAGLREPLLLSLGFFLFSLALLASVLLTELVVATVGEYLLQLTKPVGQYLTPADREAVDGFAKAISVLSPQHMGARILGDLFGVSNLWPDIHVVVPVFVVVVAAGYWFARRIYLDQFVR